MKKTIFWLLSIAVVCLLGCQKNELTPIEVPTEADLDLLHSEMFAGQTGELVTVEINKQQFT
ncbi:MAG: hypothetical protein MI922_03020, partial [Bacteroidales bacterium]|nr:hypothetical protein [Bacteroidales bacterium]